MLKDARTSPAAPSTGNMMRNMTGESGKNGERRRRSKSVSTREVEERKEIYTSYPTYL